MSSEGNWVAVAIVARPHALGGGVLVKALTRSPEELLDSPLERVYVRRKNRIMGTLTISRMAIHKGMPFIFFKEIKDRTAAEQLMGAELVIPEEERWELPKGQFYADDLEGIELVDSVTGNSLGIVKKAEEGSAHDYLVFDHPDKPGQQVRLPIVDDFVLSIDLEARRAEVHLPEGLLDL